MDLLDIYKQINVPAVNLALNCLIIVAVVYGGKLILSGFRSMADEFKKMMETVGEMNTSIRLARQWQDLHTEEDDRRFKELREIVRDR